jgi:fatty-acyl-CoA synthase
VVYAGGSLTYRALDEEAGRLASALAGLGVTAGARVAYVGMNSATFLVTMLACWRVRAVFVPVNFRLAAAEVAAVVGLSGARVVIAEQGHRAIVDSAAAQTRLTSLVLVDNDPEIPAEPCDGSAWQLLSDLLATAPAPPPAVVAGTDDVAVLMFTSGTTGRSKGVVLTFGNLFWNGVNVELVLDTGRHDITHACAPLFHIGALNSFVVRTLVRGGTVVVRRHFDPAALAEDLETLRVNSMFGAPQMFAALAQVPGFFDRDLSALRTLVVAAAPVPPSLIALFLAHGLVLQQAWGLTETAPFATHLRAEHTRTRMGSAGHPMPFTEVRTVDVDSGAPCSPGEPGEVWVRGPNVTPGYWADPAATAAAFTPDGWFRTGDIGYLDDEGFLFLVDRLKDMIISGGENVYPAEVERVLAGMPGITDVAVVGVPDERWGETVIAVVSTAEGFEVSLEDVRGWAQSSIARYKLPHRLRVVTAVPRNASGKLDKIAIRALVREQG